MCIYLGWTRTAHTISLYSSVYIKTRCEIISGYTSFSLLTLVSAVHSYLYVHPSSGPAIAPHTRTTNFIHIYLSIYLPPPPCLVVFFRSYLAPVYQTLLIIHNLLSSADCLVVVWVSFLVFISSCGFTTWHNRTC